MRAVKGYKDFMKRRCVCVCVFALVKIFAARTQTHTHTRIMERQHLTNESSRVQKHNFFFVSKNFARETPVQ